MTIDVQYQLTHEPISVAFGYFENGEFIIEECNHHGVHEEEATSHYMSFDGPIEHTVIEQVCDRCEAWYNDLESEWQGGKV